MRGHSLVAPRERRRSIISLYVVLGLVACWSTTPPAGASHRGVSARRIKTSVFDKGRVNPEGGVIPVNSTSDAANPTDGLCTLREAINNANADTATIMVPGECAAGIGADTIDLTGISGTISLTSALPLIASDITIRGPGAGSLTIQRSTASGTPNFRIFTINPGQRLSLNATTVANGSVVGTGASGIGGNIFSDQGSTLIINNSVIKDASNGGGISNLSGSVTINNSTISGNGGVPGTSGSSAIYNTVPTNDPATAPATVTINNSTISGNNNGGGIHNSALVGNSASPATVVVNNSTITGNTSNTAGGGAAVDNGVGTGGTATVALNNCTISGNTNLSSSSGAAGAIYNNAVFSGSNPTNATVTVTNSTIFGNATGSGGAGGILPNSFSSVANFKVAVKLRNTIVAGNTAAGGSSDIAIGGVDPSSSFNLIGTGGSGGLTNGTNNNQVGVANPGLGPLTNNGGPTMTHALLAGSPALDAGDNCVTQAAHCGDSAISQMSFDQRGLSRLVDGPDADTTATVDIGAYESQTPLASLPDTSTNEDTPLVIGFDPGDTSTITSVTASSDAAVVPNDASHLSVAINGSTGVLTISPAADANGPAHITITVNRSGGASESRTFLLTVIAVNDPPTYVGGLAPTVLEDAGPQTVVNFVFVTKGGGPDEAGQNLTFTFLSNPNPALFSVAPAISPTGTLTYTPAPDAFGTAFLTTVLKDDGGTANGGNDTSATGTFALTVTGVNDPPSFAMGPDQTVNEDTGAHSVPNWASSISPGPGNESGQTVSFLVFNNNNALFSAQPSVSASGALTYTLAPNANGAATVGVTAKDTGGTANGGVDASVPQNFTITVNPINDPPSFIKGANQTISEDFGPVVVPGWATNISPGPADEATQTLIFTVTNDNNGLFSANPAINPAGVLTYTAGPNANGTATVTVTAKDNGGTANGGLDTSATQTFTNTVTAINDAPSFVKGADQTVLDTAGPQTIGGWATNISPGPSNESSQTVAFQIIGNSNAAIFSTPPSISSDGTLTFTPALHTGGSANIRISLKDNGGTANGGSDTSAIQSFTITVTPIGGFFKFEVSAADYSESASSIAIPITRGGDTSIPASVDYATNEDNGLPCATISQVASPKCDFTAAYGTLQFAVGETSKTVTILITQDSFAEIPEDMTLTLSNPTGGAALAKPSQLTITIHDDSPPPAGNVIDDPNNFVRMHYHDFLNREPDQPGLIFWTGQMSNCGSPDLTVCRVNVSGAFFLSIEFQQTGYLVERMYKTAYGDATGISTIGGAHQIFVPVVRFNEFLKDTQRVGQGIIVGQNGWQQALENNKQAYTGEFVASSRFISAFPTTLTPAQFVDKLNTNAANVLSASERQTAINLFGNAADTTNASARAQALRQVAEDQDLFNAEFNRAFVQAQYFGYLRRNPNDAPDADYTGYDFWLGKLNQFNGDYIKAEMVKAFIAAAEYRQRFGAQ